MIQIFRPIENVVNDNICMDTLNIPGAMYRTDANGYVYIVDTNGNRIEEIPENKFVELSGDRDTSRFAEFTSIKSRKKQLSDGTWESWVSPSYRSTIPSLPGRSTFCWSCYCDFTYANVNKITSQYFAYVGTYKKNGEWVRFYWDNLEKQHISGNIWRFIWRFPTVTDADIVKVSPGAFSIRVSSELESDAGFFWVFKPKFEYGANPTPYCPSIYDNVAWDYDQYGASYQSQKIGDIANVISYNYKKSRTQVGTFTMTIKKGTLFADQIEPNTFIYYDKDWLIVNDVTLDDEVYTITGTDGKGLLAQRITLYDVAQDTGTMGYDVIQGSTELCLKHYIANNIVNPLDANRVIPAFTLGENLNRGIANDSYMSRLEPLHELCEKLCKNANIGYDVKVDLLNNKQIFDVIDVTDRSASQRDRNQIIFEKGRNNVLSMEREVGNSNEKNVFYAVKSGGNLEADATVIAVTRGEAQAAGIYRREMQLNVSCESVADIALYARQQMTPYQKTDSFKISAADVENFDNLFFIGDKVTIRDKSLNVTADVIIEGATKEIENGKKSITLEFGEGKPKIINQLNQKIIQKGV